MNGHTPGPWDCTGCKFPDDDMGGVYYRIQAIDMRASAANASLVAAAPDLLEALECASIIGATENADAFRLRQDRWLKDIYSPAIAKATGAQ